MPTRRRKTRVASETLRPDRAGFEEAIPDFSEMAIPIARIDDDLVGRFADLWRVPGH